MIVDAKGCAVIPMADYLKLEKDAKRYRWIRQCPVTIGDTLKVQGKNADVVYSMETLDAAVDAGIFVDAALIETANHQNPE